MKNKTKRTRNNNPPETCTIDGCALKYYAKGYCHPHYELNRRNGAPVLKHTILTKCPVDGCGKTIPITRKMCKFHTIRKYNGTELDRPKGNYGELNHRWNGGVAEYPNHYLMKKNRKIVLKEANYICRYCSKKADRVHHVDLSKDNHSIENLAPSCAKCNSNMRRSKNNTSKYIKEYGARAQDIATWLDYSTGNISRLHKDGKLESKISDFFTLTY